METKNPKFKRDISYGVVPVYKTRRGQYLFLLVQHAAGHWSFPKGHREPKEKAIEAARRELLEEAGINNPNLLAKPTFHTRYFFRGTGGVLIGKTVIYYLGFVKKKIRQIPKTAEPEIIALRWARFEELKKLIRFKTTTKILPAVARRLGIHPTPPRASHPKPLC